MSDINDGIEPEAPPPDVAVTGEGQNAGDEPEAPTPDTPVVAMSDNAGLQHFDPNYSPVTADWDNVGLRDVGPSDLRITTEWTNAGLQGGGSMGGALVSLTPPGVGQTTATSVVRFTVTIDVVDLGYWTKISGIGMAISTTDRGESAMNFFQHHLPGASYLRQDHARASDNP